MKRTALLLGGTITTHTGYLGTSFLRMNRADSSTRGSKEQQQPMREDTKRSVNQYSALREKPSRLLTLVHHWREKNTLVQEGRWEEMAGSAFLVMLSTFGLGRMDSFNILSSYVLQ